MEKDFSISQAAYICDVSPKVMRNRFDSGKVKGYRLPLSEYRRIPRDELIKFCEQSGISLERLDEEESKDDPEIRKAA